MNPGLNSLFYGFAGFFYTGYSIAMTALLLLSLFKQRKIQGEVFNFIYVFNTVIPFVGLLYALLLCTELLTAWLWIEPAGTAASGKASWLFDILQYFALNIITVFASVLFFIRRLRINRQVIIPALVLLNLNYLLQLYMQFNRDYLPSAWSVNYTGLWRERIVYCLLLLLLLLFFYRRAHQRKRLPFKSSLLAYCLFFISYFT